MCLAVSGKDCSGSGQHTVMGTTHFMLGIEAERQAGRQAPGLPAGQSTPGLPCISPSVLPTHRTLAPRCRRVKEKSCVPILPSVEAPDQPGTREL